MSAAANARGSLRRQLGVVGLWMLMVNGIVGAGIFGLPGELARRVGEAGVWIALLCVLLILPIVGVFAALGRRHDQTGGPMLYAQVAFGPFVGFQTGWAFYVARLTAFAANLNLLVTTLSFLWPDATAPVPRALTMAAVIVLLTAVNLRRADGTMAWLGAVTAAKFVPLWLVAIGGLVMAEGNLQTGIATLAVLPVDTVGGAVVLMLYAFVGFESGLVPAADARNPQRDMPRALLAALLFAALLYTAVQLACMRLLPDLAAVDRPVVELAALLAGPVGGTVLTLAILASASGNLLGALFSTPRITWQLARDGWLPVVLSRLDEHRNAPRASVVLFAVLALALALSGSFLLLASLSVVVRLLIYLLCSGALLSGRIREPGNAGPPAAAGTAPDPGVPPVTAAERTVAVVAALIALALLSEVTADAWRLAAALLVAGSALYGVARAMR